MNTSPSFKQAEFVASGVSNRINRPWYIFHRRCSNPVIVPENEFKRYMNLGYTLICAYYNGKKYKNIYRIEGKLEFIQQKGYEYENCNCKNRR